MQTGQKSLKVKAGNEGRKDWGLLRLEGNLTLDTVDEVVKVFREAQGKYKHLRVVAQKTSGVDLGFLQLLHALTVAQKVRRGELEVELTLTPELEQLFTNTGFGDWLEGKVR